MLLRKSRWDPWASSHATITREDTSISKIVIVLLSFELFFEFVCVCCFGSLAGFQHKWGIGVCVLIFARFNAPRILPVYLPYSAGLTAFLLLLLPPLFLLSLLLLLPPLIFDKYDRLLTINTFVNVRRNRWILLGMGSAAGGLGALVVTISAFSEAGCKDPFNDPHASLGDGYKSGLKSWCKTKKASGVFLWLNLGCWIGSLIHFAIVNRRASRSVPLSSYKSTRQTSAILPESNLPASYVADESGKTFATRMKNAYSSNHFTGWAGRAVSRRWNVNAQADESWDEERVLEEKDLDRENEEEEVPMARPGLRRPSKFARFTNSRQNTRDEDADLGQVELKDGEDEIYSGFSRYSMDGNVDSNPQRTRQSGEEQHSYPETYAGGRAKTPAPGQGLIGGQLRGTTPKPGPLSRTMLLASENVYDDPFAKAHAVLQNRAATSIAELPASYRYNSEHYSCRER